MRFFPISCWHIVAVLWCFSLSACSPKYDWREVRGNEVPFYVTLPGKPSQYSRPVQLGDITAQMTMTAVDVDGATFAVGVATLADEKKAASALAMMKAALVKNIDGKVIKESQNATPYPFLEVEAKGLQQIYRHNTQVLLLARFVANGKHIYQVIVVGEEKPAMREAANTFLTSFKPKSQ